MKKLMTLGLIRKGDQILLGMKKQGFGEGRWNGFGGKVQENESIVDAMKREVFEECGLEVLDSSEVGVINFHFQDKPDQPEVHIFEILEYSGEPIETEEMRPKWFAISEIPYDEMWLADKELFEYYLAGQRFEGEVFFEDNNKVLKSEFKSVDSDPNTEGGFPIS